MARRPEDRYPTAGSLVADLERFLEDRPIAARGSGPWAWRGAGAGGTLPWRACWGWWRRCFVASTIGSAAAAYRFNSLAHREHAARSVADQAERVADRRAAEARAVVDFLINDMLGAAAPERKLGQTLTVDDLLARADGLIEGRFAGQPLVESSIRHTIGKTYFKLGRYDKAEHHLVRARDLRAGSLSLEHPDTLAVIHDLGDVYRDAGKWKQAHALFEQVLRDTAAGAGFRSTPTRSRR